jgi:hypothetical protein
MFSRILAEPKYPARISLYTKRQRRVEIATSAEVHGVRRDLSGGQRP